MASDVLSPVYARSGFKDEGPHDVVSPDARGVRIINIEEAGRVVVSLESAAGLPDVGRGKDGKPRADSALKEPIGPPRWSGYLVVGSELRPLPIGSTFDSRRGVLYWQPGPGFLGEYRFVFVNRRDGTKKFVTLNIRPKSYSKKAQDDSKTTGDGLHLASAFVILATKGEAICPEPRWSGMSVGVWTFRRMGGAQ
jgi:hypothetical protein